MFLRPTSLTDHRLKLAGVRSSKVVLELAGHLEDVETQEEQKNWKNYEFGKGVNRLVLKGLWLKTLDWL